MNERIKNEIDAYDNDKLERDDIHSLLNYCYYYSYLNLLDDARRNIVEYIDDQKLEIGSRTWYSWFFHNKPPIPVDKVSCINISTNEISKGKALDEESGEKINFVVGDAHDMPFNDSSFSLVFGSSILHHLELQKGLEEIVRVLEPGGKIIFEEPLNINPFYKLFRLFTPSLRTKDEKAFTFQELNLFKKYFDVNIYYYNFLSIPLGILAKLLFKSYENPISRFAGSLDKVILSMPILKYLAAKVLIVGTPK